MITSRRISLAILVSLGVHALAGAGVVGSSLWHAWRDVPVDVEITGMRLEDLQELPLGAPAAGDRGSTTSVVAPPRSAPARAPAPQATDRDRARPKPERVRAPRPPPSEEADKGPAPPRPTSVRSYAPQGSRVTALIRTDRLRGTPYAPAVDTLLLHLPDRRDLLEGTDLDLYRDIDAVLVATPNPLDARVTFLAVRHRLTDPQLRAALERGARATGRKLAWRTERGRPFAERRAGTAGGTPPGSRDERLILLAAPRLVVVTPPAYRSLILRGRDRGAGAAHSSGAADDATGWAELLHRIDAEDSILPADAVAMVSAVDLFSARGPRMGMNIAPGTRGALDDAPAPDATVLGLPIPAVLTMTLGVAPQPFATVDGEFGAEAAALRWEEEWPALRHKLLTNPLVVLTGFSGLIGRATVDRTGTSIRLHVDATEEETIRILEFLAAQMSALGR